MDIKIEKDVLKNATKCKKDFSCLSAKKRALCKVKYCAGKEVLFIEPTHNEYCSYQMSFGDEFVCNCPVRKEIYKRHKI